MAAIARLVRTTPAGSANLIRSLDDMGTKLRTIVGRMTWPGNDGERLSERPRSAPQLRTVLHLLEDSRHCRSDEGGRPSAQERRGRQATTNAILIAGVMRELESTNMVVRDFPQKPAIRRFQVLLDSLDRPHDPEYHWLRNERRHPANPPLHAVSEPDVWPLAEVGAHAAGHELRRRVTDHW